MLVQACTVHGCLSAEEHMHAHLNIRLETHADMHANYAAELLASMLLWVLPRESQGEAVDCASRIPHGLEYLPLDQTS